MEKDADRQEAQQEKFPRVRFELNPGLDAGKVGEFWAGEGKRRRGPAEFRQRLAEAHPQLGGMEALSSSKRKAKIEAYVADYYQQHGEKLAAAGSQIAYVWDEYAPQFFAATSKIFPGLAWPPGRYTGFMTICPPFLRWLHDKTWQVSDEPRGRGVRTSAHESLHFLFYEYVQLNFGRGGSEVDSRTQYQWYQRLDPYAPAFERAWEEAGGDIDRLFAKLEVGA